MRRERRRQKRPEAGQDGDHREVLFVRIGDEHLGRKSCALAELKPEPKVPDAFVCSNHWSAVALLSTTLSALLSRDGHCELKAHDSERCTSTRSADATW